MLSLDKIAMIRASIDAVPATPPKRHELKEGAFNATSLKQWIELAKDAGVPYVPADEVAVLNLEQLLRFEDPALSKDVMLKLAEVNASVKDGEMLRWDACAPLGVKLHLAAGNSPSSLSAEDKELHPGDPRAFDILYEYPSSETPVLKRPIVSPLEVDGYPVEFRIFIKNGQVVAVSNYYPQMDLPFNEQNKAYADKSLEYAEAILLAISSKYKEQHYLANRGSYSANINATIDFMVMENGEVALLEGGPGFGYGAHPCCFYNDEAKIESDRLAELSGYKFSKTAPGIAFDAENSKKIKL